MQKSRLAASMVDFAIRNSFTINPRIGYSYFVDNVRLLGNCACAPERKRCPCPEAKKEVRLEGTCKCGLFWRDLQTFLALDPASPRKRLPKHKEVKHGNQD